MFSFMIWCLRIICCFLFVRWWIVFFLFVLFYREDKGFVWIEVTGKVSSRRWDLSLFLDDGRGGVYLNSVWCVKLYWFFLWGSLVYVYFIYGEIEVRYGEAVRFGLYSRVLIVVLFFLCFILFRSDIFLGCVWSFS